MTTTEDPQDTGPAPQAISFGEIVFDRFEGATHLGGAPLNFAVYLRQFGVSVALVSAVGRDGLGESAMRSLAAAGVETTWVQSRPEPTGTVDVRVVDGKPEFEVAEGCAWEQIGLEESLKDLRPTLLYFGTLAQNSAKNRESFGALCALRPRHVLLDVNLRPPLDSPDLVVGALDRATVLKMNEEEWQSVRRAVSMNTPAELLKGFGLEMIALTRGREGAELHLPDGKRVAEAPRVEVVDPIGSGDAFGAGLVLGADPQHVLQVACEAGAAAVQKKGALVDLPDRVRDAFA